MLVRWRSNIQEKHMYKKYVRMGVGGMNCPCCFPAPGKRKGKFRTAKRKEKREAFKCEELNY